VASLKQLLTFLSNKTPYAPVVGILKSRGA